MLCIYILHASNLTNFPGQSLTKNLRTYGTPLIETYPLKTVSFSIYSFATFSRSFKGFSCFCATTLVARFIFFCFFLDFFGVKNHSILDLSILLKARAALQSAWSLFALFKARALGGADFLVDFGPARSSCNFFGRNFLAKKWRSKCFSWSFFSAEGKKRLGERTRHDLWVSVLTLKHTLAGIQ